MVDVADKLATVREAVAECIVRMAAETVAAVREGTAKGDALQVARVAGLMAAKRTPELIPLCHPLPLTSVSVDFDCVEAGVPITERICDAIIAAIVGGADLVVTTGGTGLGPRDVTPQATSMLIDYEVPGLGELMRRAGAAKTPNAVLSRGLAGVRGQSLILNVPGSPKGAVESLEAVMPVLDHAMQLLHGDTKH